MRLKDVFSAVLKKFRYSIYEERNNDIEKILEESEQRHIEHKAWVIRMERDLEESEAVTQGRKPKSHLTVVK